MHVTYTCKGWKRENPAPRRDRPSRGPTDFGRDRRIMTPTCPGPHVGSVGRHLYGQLRDRVLLRAKRRAEEIDGSFSVEGRGPRSRG
jgi:hypothetical protein